MTENEKIIALRMDRQHLLKKAVEDDYIKLYRDLQPGLNVYWSGFGDPPSLSFRAEFNDLEFNKNRQMIRHLVKGRFAGGNLGWIEKEELRIFKAVYQKPLTKMTFNQEMLLELINREGPLNIQQMKEATKLLVKEITPILHRFQEAFLVYEDQNDGEWDRAWYKFEEFFPNLNEEELTLQEALTILLKRFSYRHVFFTLEMAKNYFKLSAKILNEAIKYLTDNNVLLSHHEGFILKSDLMILDNYQKNDITSVFALHRNDFLVKAHEEELKKKFIHSYPDTLYYLLIDGIFQGVVAGKFRYTVEVEDIIVNLSEEEAISRKNEIFKAIKALCGNEIKLKRFLGVEE